MMAGPGCWWWLEGGRSRESESRGYPSPGFQQGFEDSFQAFPDGKTSSLSAGNA